MVLAVLQLRSLCLRVSSCNTVSDSGYKDVDVECAPIASVDSETGHTSLLSSMLDALISSSFHHPSFLEPSSRQMSKIVAPD